jgi:elongator complex protein 1
MYDFDLVILVAQKSQKDPKEYLSFLAELQKHDKFYQRYLIDKHLKRYDQALVSLSDGPAEKYFAECLALVVERKLFVQAIDIYSKQADTSLLDQVLDKYGDFLYSDKHYGQAALGASSLSAGLACLPDA